MATYAGQRQSLRYGATCGTAATPTYRRLLLYIGLLVAPTFAAVRCHQKHSSFLRESRYLSRASLAPLMIITVRDSSSRYFSYLQIPKSITSSDELGKWIRVGKAGHLAAGARRSRNQHPATSGECDTGAGLEVITLCIREIRCDPENVRFYFFYFLFFDTGLEKASADI